MNRLSTTSRTRGYEGERESARVVGLEANNNLETIHELFDEAAHEANKQREQKLTVEQREYNPEISFDNHYSLGLQSRSSYKQMTPRPYGESFLTGEQHSVLDNGTQRGPRFSDSSMNLKFSSQPVFDQGHGQRRRLMSGGANFSPERESRDPSARKTAHPDLHSPSTGQLAVPIMELRGTTTSQEVSIDYASIYYVQDMLTEATPSDVPRKTLLADDDPFLIARRKLIRARELKQMMHADEGEDIHRKYTLSRLRML